MTAIAVLVCLNFFRSRFSGPSAQPPAVAVAAPPAAATASSELSGVSLLQNGGFEEGFTSVQPDIPTKSKITGMFPSGWYENSSWADVDLAYDQDTIQPHGGAKCTKITLSSTRMGQAQFAQKFSVPSGTKLHAAVWLRADKPMTGGVEVAMREGADPANWYGRQPVEATTDWKRVEVSGTTNKSGEVFFMVIITQPGVSVYVDDVTLVKE